MTGTSTLHVPNVAILEAPHVLNDVSNTQVSSPLGMNNLLLFKLFSMLESLNSAGSVISTLCAASLRSTGPNGVKRTAYI